MSLLSAPLTQMAAEYDAVVVGSGYGGSVSVATLARTRRQDGTPLRVALLERGFEIPVGQFPHGTAAALRQIQIEDRLGGQGSDTGLYNFHVDDDVTVLRGSGLGGTSLINANVSVPPDDRVWDEHWPAAIRNDLDSVRAGIERAGEVLRPTPYPDDAQHPKLLKYAALEESAAHLGKPVYHVPINVTFEDGMNASGIEQRACIECGDCVTGCNFHAKNTLMMNYLPEARADGAEVFCGVDVRHVAQGEDGRWLVHYQPLGLGRETFAGPPLVVSAEIVVLAAGAPGSTGILLRSREQGLACSDMLGARFTGNGDVLGFAYNGEEAVNGIGIGPDALRVHGEDKVGPTITGVIDMRDTPELEDGYFLEEGALPSPLRKVLPTAFAFSAPLVGTDTDRGFWDEAGEALRILQSEVAGADVGALHNTQTFLVMAHDDAQGQVTLENGRVRLRWPGIGRTPLFKRVYEVLTQASVPGGATMLPSPIWNRALGFDVITVHPLGGCVMGEDATKGVVSDRGAVFAGTAGDVAHDGLYVLDGSIVPRPLGVNPLLTISGLAERGAHLIGVDRGWAVEDRPSARPKAEHDGQPAPDAGTSLWFSERLTGFISTDPDPVADPMAEPDRSLYEDAEQDGRDEGSRCSVVVTILSPDIDGMVKDPDEEAELMGTVSIPALDPEPMTVERGHFNLLLPIEDKRPHKEMRYRMPLVTRRRRRLFFEGHKVVRDEPGIDVWSDTTTLYSTVHEGDEDGPVVARGIVRIGLPDFTRLLSTLETRDPLGDGDPRAAAKFGELFAGGLWQTYGLGERLRR